jgi:hypothetical protein
LPSAGLSKKIKTRSDAEGGEACGTNQHPNSSQSSRRLYQTENLPLKDKPTDIHCFIGGCDWLISEYDGEDLFFGYAIIGNPAFGEWGYISFTDLKQIKVPPGIEVDCEFFDPLLRASEIEEIRIH